MRTPKAPAGFVPVDSEEARGIADDTLVWGVFISRGRWVRSNEARMMGFRAVAKNNPDDHYHVQLPPAVEWEEVWGWMPYDNVIGWCLTKNGKPHEGVTDDQLDTIVRALNEMENQC